MNRRRLLVLVLLVLIFTMTWVTYVYVARQGSEGITEQAKASEITQSQLNVLENQVDSQSPNSQNPNISIDENSTSQNSPTLDNNGTTSPFEDNATTNPTPDGSQSPSNTTNQTFSPRKPEISNEAAQTTVNLVVTDPNEER